MKKSLFALASGTLALGITEYVMMGILPDMALDLGISIDRAGHLISAYAIGVCAGAPLTVLIARKQPLKIILYGLVLMILAGNLCTAFAPGYSSLLFFRFVAGLPHGSFFGVGSIVAERVSREGKSTQAVSIMISGMTIANLVGVPLGTFISHYISWRTVFFAVAAWSVLVLFLIHTWVPVLAAMPDTGIKGQFRFLKKRGPWIILLATVMGNGGIFCFYSYVSPYMTKGAGFSSEYMTFIMMLAGLGMVAGNLAGGQLSDRFSPQKTATSTQAFACLALLLLFLFPSVSWLSLAMMIVCTASLFAISSPEQLLILQNSRGSELLGAALVQVAFNLGNALGAYCGGVAIRGGHGYEYTALYGIPFAIMGFVLLFYYTWYQGKRSS